jgi:hypothetical protein
MLTDQELDQLLAHATKPNPPVGFEQKLLAKLGSNIVAFPQKKKSSLLVLALPLAASLALGLWLGSAGTIDSFVPQFGSTVAVNDAAPITNLDNLDLLLEDKQS